MNKDVEYQKELEKRKLGFALGDIVYGFEGGFFEKGLIRGKIVDFIYGIYLDNQGCAAKIKIFDHEDKRNLGIVLYADVRNIKKLEKEPVNPEYIFITPDETYFTEVIDILRKNGHWG